MDSSKISREDNIWDTMSCDEQEKRTHARWFTQNEYSTLHTLCVVL